MTTYPATEKQLAFITTLAGERGAQIDPNVLTTLTKATASDMITSLLAQPKATTAKVAVATTDTLAAALQGIVVGKYALGPEPLRFVEVVERKSGKRYLNELKGAPGTFTRLHLPYSVALGLAQEVAVDQLRAAKAFADHYSRCARCLAELTDELSRARGIGPHCWTYYQAQGVAA